MSPAMRREFCQNRSDRECHGKGMHIARQISRRFYRTTGARARSAAGYSITATISVVPDPLEAMNVARQMLRRLIDVVLFVRKA